MRTTRSSITAGVLATLVSAGAPEPASAGLVARWHFDEAPGATVAEDGVGAVDGTLSGDAAFVPGGVLGNAVRVTRAGAGIVNMGDHFDFAATDFSVAGWVRTLAPDDTTTDSVFVGRHVGGIVSGYFLALNQTAAMGGPGRALFFHNNFPAFTPISTSADLNDGGWHQVVGTFQDAGSARIYVDGRLEDTKPSTTLAGNTGDFLIGGVSDLVMAPATTFDGFVDEVSVYDHVLSPVEVADLYADVSAPTQLADLSTGWHDGLGSVIAAPGVDDDWDLVGAPGGVTLGAASVTLRSPSWFDPTADGAAWIAPPDQTNSSGQSSPAGTYTFRRTFEIPMAIENAAFVILGLYQSDNQILEIRLNGHALAAGVGGAFGAGFEGPFWSDDPDHFATGTNVIEVDVENGVGPDPNPVGFVLAGAVRYGPGPVQVPALPLAAALLLVPALLGAAWRRMRAGRGTTQRHPIGL